MAGKLSVVANMQCIFVFQLESWPRFVHSRFNYSIYSISFPSDNAAEWKKLFKPCASQRLFLPVSFLQKLLQRE